MTAAAVRAGALRTEDWMTDLSLCLHASDGPCRADRGEESLACRGCAEQPRPHRRGERRAQCLLFHLSGGGAGSGAGGRARGYGRRATRAAARRADRDQGPDAHQGEANHFGFQDLRELGAGFRRPHRRAPARRRQHSWWARPRHPNSPMRAFARARSGATPTIPGIRRARRAARPADRALRSRPAACRSPRAPTLAARSASRRPIAVPSG